MTTNDAVRTNAADRTAAPVRGIGRRSLVKGAALAGALAAAFPLAALADSDGKRPASADAAPATDQAADCGLPTADGAVIALNEVVYPELISSADYEKFWEVLEVNQLDDEFLAALGAFANDLACFGIGQQEADPEHPNVCLSPASLYFALALLAQGAGPGSQTAEQLLGVLYADDAARLADNCGKLMRTLWARTTPEGDERPCTMQVANAVWMRSDIPFEQAFLDTAAQLFYAECFGVSGLDGDADQARASLEAAGEHMGAWVAEHTGGTLEPQFALDPSWIAGLINTVWFKDAWSDEFNANDTALDVFHAATGDVTCDFMTQTKNSEIARGAGVTVAALGMGSGARLTFVLPDEGTDPRMLLGRAAGVGKLFNMEAAEYAHVTFVVPKLSFDTKMSLTQVCEAMGVRDVFGDAADLTALTPAEARVSSVEQGTHFAMDEQGVEASAYTAVMVMAMGMEPQDLEEVELRLDRPFLFRLTSPDGVVLFDGLVGDPTAA